ncbi:MAG TPA: alpha/beta hydrolase-fold protein [Actinomycetes bacterium]|jgi:hypothetical protein|nr:alpha/beta hydrolase-fold protein [Actinomycetes bacterium]
MEPTDETSTETSTRGGTDEPASRRGARGAPVAAGSAARTYEGSIGGAQYRVEVPGHWNGTLLLWSRGLYPPGFLPDEIQLTNQPATKGWLLDHGYAVAASNFRTPDGWAVKEALGDQVALLDWFQGNIGQPRRTISVGSSMGGLIAVLLAERNAHRFDGVASLCGPLAGGLDLWNTWLDVNFAIKTLLAPNSDLQLALQHGCRLQEDVSVPGRPTTTPHRRSSRALAQPTRSSRGCASRGGRRGGCASSHWCSCGRRQGSVRLSGTRKSAMRRSPRAACGLDHALAGGGSRSASRG